MFTYFKKKPQITITDGVTRSTLPMQYGEVMGSPAHKKKLKRRGQLERIHQESGKGSGALDWYKQNEKIINPR